MPTPPSGPRLAYPPAPRQDLVDDLHGRRVADPYRWLEDPGSRESRAWSAAQHQLARNALDALPGRDRLSERLTALLAAGMVGTPVWRGERAFYLRRGGDQEHPVLLVREADGGERVLVDPVAVDPSGATTLDAWEPDLEGKRLAYQASSGGDEESQLHVIDVTTGEPVEGPIDRCRYSPIAWLPGGESFYYVRRLHPSKVPDGEEQYHRRVWLHHIGGDPDEDPMVFGEGLEPTNYYGVTTSRDGRWLLVTAAAGTAPRNDVWIADLTVARERRPAFVTVQEGVDAQTAPWVGRDGRLYLLTDRDAPRGRLCVADPERPLDWRELVAEDAEAVLDDVAVLDGPGLDRGLLVLARTRHTIGELVTADLGTGEVLRTVPLPGLGTVAGLTDLPEGGHEAWLGWTDHVTPPSVLRFDARTGEVSRWAAPPGAVDVPATSARQVTYRSADGTEVRMLVLAPPECADGPDRPRPTILYGYGGFGVSLTPAYSATALAWVERGGVWVTANLRGGSEEGEDWHRGGMREHKQRVFEDFEAAADRLADDGWTTPDRLVISGGSNGGLLVGAALTRHPERYAGVLCSAPLLDMVRYEQFGLGPTWTDEYGSAEVAEELDWLLGYSPYHHVREGAAYPAVLFTVFDSDTRVDPLHARKMCAALQHATASDRPVLLRAEGDVGHGARSVSRSVGLSVDSLAFAASVVAP